LSGEKTPVPVAGAPAGTVIEAFGNVAKYEVKGKPGVFIWVTLLHSPNPIDQVLGMFTEDVENVITSVVTAGATKPNLAPALPNGLVATQYFYVTPDVAPEKIKKGLISFFVEKSWLEENGFHKWSVVLYRLNSVTNEWQALQAQLVSENATRVHYDRWDRACQPRLHGCSSAGIPCDSDRGVHSDRHRRGNEHGCDRPDIRD
jgi:PGF-pre-PGF domain-containing protein